MDGQRVRQWEAQCIQEQLPACSAACPVHVDARKMVRSIAKGDFGTALKTFQHSITLPRIISHICDHPCQQACRRNEAGDPVNISALERAAVAFGGNVASLRRFGTRPHSVAIVGGGISGVAATLDLAVKGYTVELFESAPNLLPRLRNASEGVLPSSAIDADLASLAHLGAVLHSRASVTHNDGETSLCALLQRFSAVYLAIGAEGKLTRFLEAPLTIDPVTYTTNVPRLFAGGSMRYGSVRYSPITSFQDGRYAALSIDRFLQGASLTASRELQGSQESHLYTEITPFVPLPQVAAADAGIGYTREEAQKEADRCFPCSCMECVKVCEYLKEYRSYPKRYVREIYNNLCIVMGVRNGNRMINSCSLCGLCQQVCPEKMSMAEVCLDARQTMVATKKMPVSAHEFALRDMAFSTGDAFAMARHQPGFQESAWLFFPGCQLSASSPEHVQSCYQLLCEICKGGVGLMLNCCGAPALWAGRKELFEGNCSALKNIWQQMGQPKVIAACSSCFRTLKENLSEVPIDSLWPHLNSKEAIKLRPQFAGRAYAIHDPCSTRGVSEVEDSVRGLLQRMGVQGKELNPRGQTTCCGYGGLTRFANPELTDKSVQRRAKQSEADYITYCAMCRDSFALQGKRAVHVLDLVFEGRRKDPAARPDPGFSRRQENRARLKSHLLEELWGEKSEVSMPELILQISEAVRQVMERRMILESDVRKTIEAAESRGQKFKIPNGHFLATHCPASVTYWVEYTPGANGACEIYNAYSHRMQVR